MNGNIDSIKNGLLQAKNNTTEIIIFIVNYIVIPIAVVIILGFLVFSIIAMVKKHRQQDNMQQDITDAVICVIVLALVISFPSWGWKMIGMSIFPYNLIGII